MLKKKERSTGRDGSRKLIRSGGKTPENGVYIMTNPRGWNNYSNFFKKIMKISKFCTV